MSKYFTSSSQLKKEQQRKFGGSSYGTQNYDPHFPDSIPGSLHPEGNHICYSDQNMSNGVPFHPQWSVNNCPQNGGASDYGPQNFDPQFQDHISIDNKQLGNQQCYGSSSNSGPFHPSWSPNLCPQRGGYRQLYKKYKQKYKQYKNI